MSALFRTTKGCAPLAQTAGDKALDAVKIEVAVQSADDERQLDVGGHRLHARLTPGDAARERAAPRKHALDGGGAIRRGLAIQNHPIAHARQSFVGQRLPKSSGKPSERAALARQNFIEVSVLGRDSRQDWRVAVARLQLSFEERAEAQSG